MKILCIGPQWRGSNARALFNAFLQLGQLVHIVDESYYIPLYYEDLWAKIGTKLFWNRYEKSFNNAILKEYNLFQPDVVLVYKGAFVFPSTVLEMKEGSKVVNFYPDVSFHTHGNHLQKTLPLYDKVFTTKTFGVQDMKEQLGQENGVFIPHGFDPEVHRPIDFDEKLKTIYQSDASFIGTWSPHKEDYLTHLKHQLPNINLKIWGGQWESSSSEPLKNSIQNQAVFGDLYAAAIQSSKINIALLSEKVRGASSGDNITSRTFHIPACQGFMLHQDSDEINDYYSLGEEIDVFSSKGELVEKVKFYLRNEHERTKIQIAGYNKSLKDHSISGRAKQVINVINELL